tara:strand:+ start:765 stop:878 length:114 start_codon:yes stop_codon:yes gene_type:complete
MKVCPKSQVYRFVKKQEDVGSKEILKKRKNDSFRKIK